VVVAVLVAVFDVNVADFCKTQCNASHS